MGDVIECSLEQDHIEGVEEHEWVGNLNIQKLIMLAINLIPLDRPQTWRRNRPFLAQDNFTRTSLAQKDFTGVGPRE